MKKVLLTVTLLAVTASVAFAGGLNFTWGGTGCYRENPQILKTFACNTNSGSATMVGSFATTNDMPGFVGVEVVVDGQSIVQYLPQWWDLYNGGSCRSASLSTSADFTAAPGVECLDPWNNLGAGGVGAWQTFLYPPPPPLNVPATNACRLKVAYALTEASPLIGGVEYYGFKAIVNYQKTVGTSCWGCSWPVTFVLNEIKAAPLVGKAERINNAIDNVCIHWQGQAFPCGGVPAKNSTWGQVKGLYR
jgi:hypothetical protein